MATSKKTPPTGRTGGTRPPGTSAGTSAGSSDGPRGDWREELLAVAGQIFDDELLRRVASGADRAGRVGDLVLAAHLEDLRLVEEARFHRARRDAGRALASGDKQGIARAQEQVRVTGDDLGLLRMQRDLATGDLQVDGQPDGEYDDPKPQSSAT